MLGALPILPLPAPPADGNLGPTPPAQVTEDSNDEKNLGTNDDQKKANDKSSAAPASVATHTRTIGIIYPPPDIRNIVDKTAQFVAKNGPEFEKRIIANNEGNAKFNFLRPSDPYHAYYQHRLSEARAQNQSAAQQQPSHPAEAVPESASTAPAADTSDASSKPDPAAQFRPVRKVLEPPEAEQYTVRLPEGITGEELDIIKLTAQFGPEMGNFADDEDEDLPPPMTLDEVIRRSKMSTMEEEDIVEPGKEVEMEMDEEEVQLVEEGMRAASLEENGDMKNNEAKATPEEQEPPMRIVKNWKRPEERIPAERDPTKYVVSPITGELILINEMSEHMRISLIDPKYKEQKERMFAKIRETTLAADDEISRNIVGLARTRPDIFGTTEEEVSNAVKAEIEKKKDEQPKQVIWDGHTGSIGRTASQAMSQNTGGEDTNDAFNNDGRSLPGPAPPPPRPGMPSVRPLPPPPGLVLNIPRPPAVVQYSGATGGGIIAPPPPGPPVVNMIPSVRPPPPSMPMMHGQPLMANRPPMPPSMPLTSPNIAVPPPPGSQFTPLGGPRPFVPVPVSQPGMPMVPPPPMPQGMPPPPPPEEAPPPLPDEPEPKRQRLDDSMLIPEDQFLAQHSGPAVINISVPNVDEGNLKAKYWRLPCHPYPKQLAV
ncbi:UNVERIFIED_CONTAM: putative splicing factor 3A subunit [Sesamum radiatum]|uniref:Splicing factor 3A subunit n=1 Tax=Sesamum radiatum TaxID=300843 RepID=A0AAW2T2Q5_SESRA